MSINTQAIRDEVDRISESRLTTVVNKGYKTVIAVKNIASSVWNSSSAGAAYVLGDITSNLFRIATEIFKSSKVVRFVAARVRMIALFSIPFAFAGMCTAGKKMALGEDRANSGITFAQNLGWFADSADASIRLIREFGTLTVKSNALLGQALAPLIGISLGSHFISFGWNLYAIHENRWNENNLTELLLEPAKLAKALYVEQPKIEKALNENADKAKEAFRNRFKSKIVHHSLSAVALIVSATALAVLATSGAVITSAIISTAGSVIFLGALVYELNAESKLEAFLGEEPNTWKSYAVIAGIISLMSLPILIAGKIIRTR